MKHFYRLKSVVALVTLLLTCNIAIAQAPAITSNPNNSTVCEGIKTTFIIRATNATSYQWEVSTDGGSTYNNVSNGTDYSGATIDTLTIISADETMDANLYRCVASGATSPDATSTAAKLSVNTAPDITTQPSGSTICDGGNTSFTIAATGTGLSYQWQVSSNGGTSYSNVNNGGVYSGATTNKLDITSATANGNGLKYRCVINGTCGNAATSNAATLTVNTPQDVITDPANATVCNGGNTSFAINTSGTVSSYKWEVSTDGGSTWATISNGGIYSGAKSDKLILTGATLSENNNQYRSTISGPCATDVVSSEATLTINTLPAITSQPSNHTICEGGNTSFNVAATGTGLTYQWQVSTNGGTSYSNVANGGVYAGATTNKLEISNATENGDGLKYKCIVSGACTPSVTSDAVTLTVNDLPSVTSQPSNSAICDGDNTSFSITASGTNISYQWEMSTDGGATWTTVSNGGIYSGAKSSTLVLTNATGTENNNQYRNVVSGTCSPEAVSNPATLTILPLPSFTAQPTDETVCPGTNASFSVTTSGSVSSYQWQMSTDGGSTWSAVVNGGIYSGATTSTLQLTGVSISDNQNEYRCFVSGICQNTSDDATLNVAIPTQIIEEASSKTICDGGNTSFGIDATGTGLTYVWQVSTDNGNNYTDITDGGIYSNATTNTLNITAATTNEHNNMYRVVVTDMCGVSKIGVPVTLEVYVAPTITQQPANTTICFGDTATYTTAGTASTTVTYQWQYNYGNGWINLSNFASFSGAFTNTLTVANPSVNYNNYEFRCLLKSAGCATLVPTDAATLTINTLPSVITNPTKKSICPTDNTSFFADASGTGVSFQWQVNTGSGWLNLSNGGVYSDVTDKTLSLTNVPAGMNGYQYRCMISGTCTPSVATTAATLSVGSVPAITTQPSSKTVCGGNPATFSVSVTGSNLTYQWQYLNGASWIDVPHTAPGFSGAESSTLTINDVNPKDSSKRSLRCVVVGNCGSVTSATAVLTIYGTPEFSTIPPIKDSVCENSNYGMSVTASGLNINYQWQVNTGTGWTDLSNGTKYSGVTTSGLQLYNVPLSFDGYKYRCVVNGTCSPDAVSTPMTLSVLPLISPTITVKASSTDICDGDKVTFTTTTTTAGNSPDYQWKVNGSDVGANSDTYSNSSLSDNDHVWCVLNSSYMCPDKKPLPSNKVAVRVTQYSPVSVTISSSEGNIACSGRPITFSAQDVNGGNKPTYEWKVNNTSVGVNKDTFVTNSLQDGDVVLVELTSNIKCPSPNPAPSNKITMTINQTTKSSIVVAPNPGKVVCDGDTVTLTTFYNNGGTTPKFQWVVNGNDIPGATSATYITDDIKDGDMIQCELISSAQCVFPESSQPITFEVPQSVTPSVSIIVYQSGPDNYTFEATPVNGGTNPTYRWYLNGVLQAETSNMFQTKTLGKSDKVYAEMISSVKCVTNRIVNSKQITTAVENVSGKNNELIKVYPNPNSGTFRVELPDGVVKGGSLTLRDMLGKEVYSVDFGVNQELLISLPEIANGLYMLDVNNGDDIYKSRVMIKR